MSSPWEKTIRPHGNGGWLMPGGWSEEQRQDFVIRIERGDWFILYSGKSFPVRLVPERMSIAELEQLVAGVRE